MPLLRELRPAGGVVVLRAAELEQPAGVSESKQHVLWYLLSWLQLRNPVEVEIMNNAQLMLFIEAASTNQVTFSVEATETPFFPPRDAIEAQSGNIYPKGGEKKPVRKEITNPMSGDRVSSFRFRSDAKRGNLNKA